MCNNYAELRWNVQLRDFETGEIQLVHNITTQAFRELFALFLKGDAITAPTHIALGNRRKLDSEDDTWFDGLKSEFYRTTISSKTRQSPDTTRLTTIILPGAGTGEIDEVGLFNAAATSLAIDACDATTNWVGGGTLTVASGFTVGTIASTHREGVGALQNVEVGSGVQTASFDRTSLNINATVYTTTDFLQFWYFVDALSSVDAGSIVVRLYTGASDYYQWSISTAADDSLDGVYDRWKASTGDATTGGWYHASLKIEDATTSGSPDITTNNIIRFTILSTKDNTVSVTEAVDDIRMFAETGTMFARFEPSRMSLKTFSKTLGISWFLSMRDGGAEVAYTAFDRETITVSTASIGFTSSKIQPTGGGDPARAALVVVRSGGPVNVTFDGTAPTSTTGSGPYYEGGLIPIDESTDVGAFRMILDSKASKDAIVECEYFR